MQPVVMMWFCRGFRPLWVVGVPPLRHHHRHHHRLLPRLLFQPRKTRPLLAQVKPNELPSSDDAACLPPT